MVGLVLFNFGELVHDLLIQRTLSLLPLLGFVQLLRFRDHLDGRGKKLHTGNLFAGRAVNARVQNAEKHILVLGRENSYSADDHGLGGIL